MDNTQAERTDAELEALLRDLGTEASNCWNLPAKSGTGSNRPSRQAALS